MGSRTRRPDRHPVYDRDIATWMPLIHEFERQILQGNIPPDLAARHIRKGLEELVGTDVNLHTIDRIIGGLKGDHVQGLAWLKRLGLMTVNQDGPGYYLVQNRVLECAEKLAERNPANGTWLLSAVDLIFRLNILNPSPTGTEQTRLSILLNRLSEEQMVGDYPRLYDVLVPWVVDSEETATAKMLAEQGTDYARACLLSAVALVTGDEADVDAARHACQRIRNPSHRFDAMSHLLGCRSITNSIFAESQAFSHKLTHGSGSREPDVIEPARLRMVRTLLEMDEWSCAQGFVNHFTTTRFLVQAYCELFVYTGTEEYLHLAERETESQLPKQIYDEGCCHVAAAVVKRGKIGSAWSWYYKQKKQHVPSLPQIDFHVAMYLARMKAEEAEQEE
jgi:hypothetical protein